MGLKREEWQKEELQLLFKTYDLDGSGKLDGVELMELASSHHGMNGKTWDRHQNERLLRVMDDDCNGSVESEEFVRYFMSTWHGGMRNMEDEDFREAIDILLGVEAAREVREERVRDVRNTQAEAHGVKALVSGRARVEGVLGSHGQQPEADSAWGKGVKWQGAAKERAAGVSPQRQRSQSSVLPGNRASRNDSQFSLPYNMKHASLKASEKDIEEIEAKLAAREARRQQTRH